MPSDDAKTRLRALRDKLAFEAPRAATSSGVSRELAQRMVTVLAKVVASLQGASDEEREDAVAEAHLALHEWERFREQSAKPAPRGLVSLPDRRRFERHEVSLTVKLDAEPTPRTARNVSLGGVFVSATRGELPMLTPGAAVHVTLSYESITLRSRAVVARRVDDGIGLQWIQDTETVKRAIRALLDAVNRPKR